MIKKELQLSHQAHVSTLSTIVTNSIYHINVTTITTRSQKVVENEEEKTTNVDHFIEVDLEVKENNK